MHDLLDELTNEIKILRNSEAEILVEGKKDKAALEYFKIKNITTMSRFPIYKLVENSSNQKEVIILTDLDKEGRQLYSRLYNNLTKFGVKVNNRFRHFLQKKTKLSHIEGLKRYYRNLRK